MSFLTKRIHIDKDYTNKAYYKGDLIHMDLFFLQRLVYNAVDPVTNEPTDTEMISLTYIILIDVFTRYCHVAELHGKGDRQGITNAFIHLLDKIEPQGPITTIADKGTEFFHLHKTIHQYPLTTTTSTTNINPIQRFPVTHKWSQSRYKAAVAEANIAVYKRHVKKYILDLTNPYTQEGINSILHLMNNRKMQALKNKTPTQMLDVIPETIVSPWGSFAESDAHPEESEAKEKHYNIGDIVVLRHYARDDPFEKKSKISTFDPELMIIANVKRLPTGTYRYHLRTFDQNNHRVNGQPMPEETYSQISFQHGEIYKPTDAEIERLLAFADNNHLRGSYIDPKETKLLTNRRTAKDE